MTKRTQAGAAVAAASPTPTGLGVGDSAAVLRELLPELSAIDIFRGVVPIVFGGQRYELAALSMAESEGWMAKLDGAMAAMLRGVQAGQENTPEVLAQLMTANDKYLDAIYDYDRDGVLPPREEVKRQARAIDAFRGVYTIWLSEHPTLAAGLVQAMQSAAPSPTNGTSPAPTSTSPTPTAGRRRRSAAK